MLRANGAFFKAQRKIEEQAIFEALSFVDKNTVEFVLQQFAQNLYVPQEILNYQILKKMWSL